MKPDKKEIIEQAREFRKSLAGGDNATEEQINISHESLNKYREFLRPNEKDEIFAIVNKEGQYKKLTAPRWLCHLLGLRHRSVHILLRWRSSNLGSIFVLQVRNWTKSDSPGHIDISVGGHVVGTDLSNIVSSAYCEMEEELGISAADLKNHNLVYRKGYESYDERHIDNFYNREWRDVYTAELIESGFEKIKFNDREVVGLYLCPESEALNLLNQNFVPIASALKLSLPYCL